MTTIRFDETTRARLLALRTQRESKTLEQVVREVRKERKERELRNLERALAKH